MAAPELPLDFRDLLVALVDEGVEFLLIGGYALAVHGHVRATDHLDVFVRPTPDNARKVLRALVEFGAPVATHGVTEGLFAREGYGYRMGLKPDLIEILTTIDGVSFDDAWYCHRRIHVEGREVPVIGRHALLANKRASGRAKDLADVEWLESDGVD